MKKQKALITFLVVVSLFSGCAKVSAGSQGTERQTVSDVKSNEPTLATPMPKTERSTKVLPLSDSLVKEIALVTTEIGVTDIGSLTILSYEEGYGGTYDVEISLVCDGKEVRISCSYLELIERWAVSGVHDMENGHCYWYPDGMNGFCDLYDFKTNEIISAKSDDFSLDEVIEKNNEEAEKAKEEFENALDELAEKYGIK